MYKKYRFCSSVLPVILLLQAFTMLSMQNMQRLGYKNLGELTLSIPKTRPTQEDFTLAKKALTFKSEKQGDLKQMQYLATLLVLQESFMQQVFNVLELFDQVKLRKNERMRFLINNVPDVKFDPVEGSVNFLLNSLETPEALAIVLTNYHLFMAQKSLSDSDKKYVAMLIEDNNPEVKFLGNLIQTRDAVNFAIEQFEAAYNNAEESAVSVLSDKRFKLQKIPSLHIQRLLYYLNRIGFNFVQGKLLKLNMHRKDGVGFVNNVMGTAAGYKELQQNYTLFYAELIEALKQLVMQEKNAMKGKNVAALRQKVESYLFTLPIEIFSEHYYEPVRLVNELVALDFKDFLHEKPVELSVKKSKQKERKKQEQCTPTVLAPIKEKEQDVVAQEPFSIVALEQSAPEQVPVENDTFNIITDTNFPGVQHYLYKTSTTVPLTINPKPMYTSWVQDWLLDPDKAYEQQGYAEFEKSRFKHRATAKLYHGFDQAIDSFIQLYGKQTTTQSRREPNKQDILITMPGKIVMSDGQETYGLYTYIIDSKNGQWYHRLFEPRTGKQLLQQFYEKGYYDVEFPVL